MMNAAPVHPMAAQPGMMMQPMAAQPGMMMGMQPMAAQPGMMMQPMAAQPGMAMMQPMAAQPGMMMQPPVQQAGQQAAQPAINVVVTNTNSAEANNSSQASNSSQGPFNGPPPPNPGGSNWFEMYLTPSGKDEACPEACLCRPCAHAEVAVWATDGSKNELLEIIAFMFCIPCHPCMITETRQAMETKIYKFHLARGDKRAEMGGSGDPHGDLWKYCFVGLIPWIGFILEDMAEVDNLTKNLAVKRAFVKANGGGAPVSCEDMER